jgi:hypothetical protein
MSSYTITIELPYHINTVIDQLVEAFTDIDFGDWHFEDLSWTLRGYEPGELTTDDFFKCDKFYVEIDSRRYVRFEFDDQQQTVYIDNDEYKCDYFTTRLKHFFPSEFYHNQFTICDQYGYERPSQKEYYDNYYGDQLDDDNYDHTDNNTNNNIDNNNNNNNDNDELYLFMDHIMEQNRIADNEYILFLNHLSTLPDVNQIICTYQTKLSNPVTYFKNNNTYNEQLCSNGKLILTFLPDNDGHFYINNIKNTMDHIAWIYDLEKDDYVITNKNTKRKFYGGINGLFQATLYEGKTYALEYATNTIKPTITCEMRAKTPTKLSLKLDYPIPNTNDYYNVEIRKDNMIFATFPCSLDGDYDHDLVHSVMKKYTTQYKNPNNDYLIINNQTGQTFAI